jgi:hypothetical protein
MGVTSFTLSKIELLIKEANVKSVLDFGAQNNYVQPKLPAPYMSEWYKERGIRYKSVDLSGENGCIVQDLTKSFDLGERFDLCCDAGTLEHVLDLYQGFKNLFNHCKVGGFIYRENPKTGNWPGHGVTYMTEQFYEQFEAISDIVIADLGIIPAMSNVIDGWNVYCLMEKTGENFPTLAEFKTLPIFDR